MGLPSAAQCSTFDYLPNAAFNPVLLPYDLTRGGTNYNYFGHADIKELALYIEDSDQGGQLAVQPGDPRGFVQRADERAAGGTPAWGFLHFQAHEHGAARFVRANVGVAVQ